MVRAKAVGAGQRTMWLGSLVAERVAAVHLVHIIQVSRGKIKRNLGGKMDIVKLILTSLLSVAALFVIWQ